MIYARINGGTFISPVEQIDVLRGSLSASRGTVDVTSGGATVPDLEHTGITYYTGGITGVVRDGGPNWTKIDGKMVLDLHDGQSVSGTVKVETKSFVFNKRQNEPIFVRMTFRFTGSVSH